MLKQNNDQLAKAESSEDATFIPLLTGAGSHILQGLDEIYEEVLRQRCGSTVAASPEVK